MGGRSELARQGVIGGGSHLLAQVRQNDELARRVHEAVDAGANPVEARKAIEEEMVMERLVEAFGAEAIKVEPVGLEEGSVLHNAQVDNLY